MKNVLLFFALLAGPVLHAGGLETPPLPGVRPALILVKGAVGSAEYAPRFESQVEAWKKMAVQAGAELLLVTGDADAPAGTTDRSRLEKILADLPREGPAEVWVVLIGHGTWDGKEARFNLEGPDLPAGDGPSFFGKAGVVGRLPAAGLSAGKDHPHTFTLDQPDGGQAGLGVKRVDQAGSEEIDPGGSR